MTGIEINWRVRPPWPEEMERLPAGLREPLSRRGARRHWLWVLVTGELERIVGAVTLAERDPRTPGALPDGRMDYAIVPNWTQSAEAVVALLDAALAQGRALGLAAIEAQASHDTSAAAWFTAQGFIAGRTQELWRVPLDANFTRRHAAVERALARRPVEVHPLGEVSLPAVRAICAAHGLLSAHRVVLSWENQTGMDPRLSFVCGAPESPSAVLLARLSGREAYLEVLARAPGAASRGPEIGALLHTYFRAAMNLGASETLCLMMSDHAPDTARLLARAEARCIEKITVFGREFPPQP